MIFFFFFKWFFYALMIVIESFYLFNKLFCLTYVQSRNMMFDSTVTFMLLKDLDCVIYRTLFV